MTVADVAVRFAISGRHHHALKSHLFPGDGKEAVAFVLCGRARRPELELLLAHDIVTIPYAVCRIRSPNQVVWPGTALQPVLERAMASGLAVAKVHSHPKGYAWFSDTDDDADNDTFPSIFGWLDVEGPLASLVMMPDGRLVGRAMHQQGIGRRLDGIRVAGDDFEFWQYGDANSQDIEAHALRIAQTFGEGTYRLLRALRIGVVGASGTGSIVIEQLARNCVGQLVIVDPDQIELKNLNRVLNSTAEDARAGSAKPAVQERAIDAMALGTKVQIFNGDLLDRAALEALSTCDVLFGCMDSVDGRHVLNRLASAYVIPLIDIGVRIDADGHGGVDSIWAAIHTVLPACSSLMSRRVYDQAALDAAFLKRTNPQQYQEQRELGYVKGVRVEQPAVISVNMEAAAAAVNEFLARVHPFRVKHNENFAVRRICISDPDASSNERSGIPCPVTGRLVGKGDQQPFLGMPLLTA